MHRQAWTNSCSSAEDCGRGLLGKRLLGNVTSLWIMGCYGLWVKGLGFRACDFEFRVEGSSFYPFLGRLSICPPIYQAISELTYLFVLVFTFTCLPVHVQENSCDVFLVLLKRYPVICVSCHIARCLFRCCHIAWNQHAHDLIATTSQRAILWHTAWYTLCHYTTTYCCAVEYNPKHGVILLWYLAPLDCDQQQYCVLHLGLCNNPVLLRLVLTCPCSVLMVFRGKTIRRK